jgi:hypothetical protein
MKQLTRISLNSGVAAEQSASFSQTNTARAGFGPLRVPEGQATTAQCFSAGSLGGRRLVPKGRPTRADSTVPPGADSQPTAHPNAESLGYCQMSLQTKPVANLLIGPGLTLSRMATAIALCAPWLALDSLAQTPPTFPLSFV